MLISFDLLMEKEIDKIIDDIIADLKIEKKVIRQGLKEFVIDYFLNKHPWREKIKKLY